MYNYFCEICGIYIGCNDPVFTRNRCTLCQLHEGTTSDAGIVYWDDKTTDNNAAQAEEGYPQ